MKIFNESSVVKNHGKQESFYYAEWQAQEKLVDQQLREGNVRVAESKEELFKDLGLDKL